MVSTLIFALVLVGTSVLTMAAVLLFMAAFGKPRAHGETPLSARSDAAMLFQDGVLIDANDRARALIDTLRDDAGDSTVDPWPLVASHLSRGYPGFAEALADLASRGKTTLSAARDETGQAGPDLVLDPVGGAVRLTLADPRGDGDTIVVDRLSYRAMQHEIALLRRITEAAPLMMWHQDDHGAVTWANGSYLQRASQARDGEPLGWPLPAVFSLPEGAKPRRVHLDDNPGRSRNAWFDLDFHETEGGRLCFAVPADDAQRAERTKQEFIQTLTKTFATLPIGLAVFDRTRRLQMFNPALTDLTNLEPEFLLSRPGIEGFLNRMREKRVLPEPRDFRSWSRRLLDIEINGPDGNFEETWTLPTGQIFRVSASPHPDGALAFLMEDITTETHLTRNVRAEMETSQAVLNLLDQALAVFAPNGQLVLTNSAFSRLWTLEGEESLSAVTLAEAIDNWRDAGDSGDLWARVATLARPGNDEPGAVHGQMTLPDGERLQVEARRTTTGAVMIAFGQEGSGTFIPVAEYEAQRHGRAQILRASA
ncbi:MAG: PAS-domain containing protein [Pararhodobacter sp.]